MDLFLSFSGETLPLSCASSSSTLYTFHFLFVVNILIGGGDDPNFVPDNRSPSQSQRSLEPNLGPAALHAVVLALDLRRGSAAGTSVAARRGGRLAPPTTRSFFHGGRGRRRRSGKVTGGAGRGGGEGRPAAGALQAAQEVEAVLLAVQETVVQGAQEPQHVRKRARRHSGKRVQQYSTAQYQLFPLCNNIL